MAHADLVAAVRGRVQRQGVHWGDCAGRTSDRGCDASQRINELLNALEHAEQENARLRRLADSRRDRILAITASMQHNHVTRDVKPIGECPGCDSRFRLLTEIERLRVDGEEWFDAYNELRDAGDPSWDMFDAAVSSAVEERVRMEQEDWKGQARVEVHERLGALRLALERVRRIRPDHKKGTWPDRTWPDVERARYLDGFEACANIVRDIAYGVLREHPEPDVPEGHYMIAVDPETGTMQTLGPTEEGS